MTATTQKLTPASAARRLAVVSDSVCNCSRCQSMCMQRPCWGTPDEARAIIDAGLGHRLMRDHWVGSPLRESGGENVSLLVPATVGNEGGDAPSWFFVARRCTFLTSNGRCELHARGLKPSEGRKAIHEGGTDEFLAHLCAATWATPKARRMVTDWQSPVSRPEGEQE